MDWEECCKKRIVKNVQEDESLITSLLKSSSNKWQSAENLILNEITAASKISLAYDALRELLESITLRQGYKIYNHECYTSFLKEIMKLSNLGDEFDEVRKIRNAINYYGKEINLEEAQILLDQIQGLILAVQKI